MKVVNKKLSKAQLATICLLIASIVFLGAYFAISAISKKLASNNSGNTRPSAPSIELIEGESSYLNQPVAYPAVQENQILLLQVDGPSGKFDISRYPDDQGSFMFHYYTDDEKSVAIPYIPPIYGAEGDFNYESLYAIEQNDGYGRIYYLTYLCSAVGSPYFKERIDLPENKEQRDALLREYGLTESERTMVSFMYGERDSKTGLIVEGSEKVRNVAIGKKALSGVGYYFMVDGRDCVYYTGSEYFKYALVGFNEFIKGMLVSAGIASDSTYEPYLTTDFKTWVGTTYKEESDKVFTYSKAESDHGYENPEVIVGADVKVSVDKGLDFVPKEDDFNGYEITANERYTFDLESLRAHADFKRIEAAFKGKNVGSYKDNEILLTLLNELYNSDSKLLDFGGEFGSLDYKYTVTAIESVISDSGERTEGQITADDTLVKITYRYENGGKSVQHDCHAVVDLNDLGDEAGKLVGQSIGKLDTPVVIDMKYTKDVYEYTVERINAVIFENGEEKTTGSVLSTAKELKITYSCKKNGEYILQSATSQFKLEDIPASYALKFRGYSVGKELSEDDIYFRIVDTNALSTNEKYVLTEVLSIFDEVDGEVVMSNKISEKSYVSIAYYRVIGGVTGKSETTIIRLCDIADTDRLAPLKTELLGKSKGELKIIVYNTDYYYECMREFATYEISSIDYFVANEQIVSFRFCNASKRDPYYGDTFFENTLKNKFKLYGLNADSCEEVVKFFGGIGSDSSSAIGLSGTTVAVGLTLENMEKYGLYAHRVYFELPRGIYDASEGTEGDSSDQISDYGWFSTLGFTLYISDVDYDEDGSRIRYIGSDMYDLVAKVPADNLDFLEKDFVEFWARRNMVMMSIEKLEKLTLDFNMEDLKGEYTFSLSFDKVYCGYVDSKYVVSDEPFEGSSPIEEERVNVTVSPDAFDTELKRLMTSSGSDSYSLIALYNQTMGDGFSTVYYPNTNDPMGPACFNDVYEILQMSRYQGMLTEEEQAAAYEREKILTIRIKVTTGDYYNYDFHRLDDRRIMVALYRTDSDGNKLDNGMQVSNFYVTTFAFKKIVGNYINLLDGKSIDAVVGYPE